MDAKYCVPTAMASWRQKRQTETTATTPSGFAVHPSKEGNEQQNASKTGRSPLTRGAA